MIAIFPFNIIYADINTNTNNQNEITEKSIFDLSKIKDGIISINYTVKNNIKTKLMIEKDETSYFYFLENNTNNTFPLQMGNGVYTIRILEHKNDNKYKTINKKIIDVTLYNENIVYLNSIQIINWNSKMKPILKVAELTNEISTDIEKVTAVYNYIIQNIQYDYEKINKIDKSYIPNINDIYKSSSGICYDYASIFAAMTRSLGIPTKLVKGYRNNSTTYHAWNEIFINELDKWIIIDTTSDANLFRKNKKFKMIKNGGEYNKVREY